MTIPINWYIEKTGNPCTTFVIPIVGETSKDTNETIEKASE